MESPYLILWFVNLHFLWHSLLSVEARFVELTKALVKMTFYLTVPILLSIILKKMFRSIRKAIDETVHVVNISQGHWSMWAR